MVELQIYAPGIRRTDRAQALGYELEGLEGVRYKVDPLHDIVHLEMDPPPQTTDAFRRIFERIGLQAHFIGAVPPECRPKKKTQPLKGAE